MDNRMNINWFPGHMTKARRMIEENTKLVDAVCEIVDARIPRSSRNPDVEELTRGKPRLIILNRVDLADPEVTALWTEYYKGEKADVLKTNSRDGQGISGLSGAIRSLLREKLAQNEAKGLGGKPVRAMVIGVPNVGKSTFINKVAGRKSAKTSDKPGVTRGKQWITVDNRLELLDTPGILWPRIDDPETGLALAFTGAVRDEILDVEELAARLMLKLRELYPAELSARYKFAPEPDMTGVELVEAAARRRGFLISGGELDTLRMAVILLDEFRGGVLGRMSLEKP